MWYYFVIFFAFANIPRFFSGEVCFKCGVISIAVSFENSVSLFQQSCNRVYNSCRIASVDYLKARIPGLGAVKVWETADSCAEYGLGVGER